MGHPVDVDVDLFFHLERFLDIVVDDGVVLDGDDTARAVISQESGRIVAHAGCQDTVVDGRRTAALDVTEDGGAGFDAGLSLDLTGHFRCIAAAFREDDDEVLLAGGDGLLHTLDDVDVEVVLELRDEDAGRTDGNAGVKGDVPRLSSHDLDDGAAAVGLGRVTDHVDHLHDGVHRGVEADGEVGTGDVVVDGAGDADTVDAFAGQGLGTAEGAVTADDDDAFDAETVAHVGRLLLTAVGHELHAAGRSENGTAALDDVGYAAQIHLRDITGHQAFIAVVDADHTHIVLEAGTDDGTDCCIHARGVAAAGENTDRFHRSTSMGVNLIIYTYIYFIV